MRLCTIVTISKVDRSYGTRDQMGNAYPRHIWATAWCYAAILGQAGDYGTVIPSELRDPGRRGFATSLPTAAGWCGAASRRAGTRQTCFCCPAGEMKGDAGLATRHTDCLRQHHLILPTSSSVWTRHRTRRRHRLAQPSTCHHPPPAARGPSSLQTHFHSNGH